MRKYVEYYFQRKDEEDERVCVLVNELSSDLKCEVLVDIYKKILTKSKFFRENLSEQCVNALCLSIKEQRFSPDETVF